jgi:hypothetical protein
MANPDAMREHVLELLRRSAERRFEGTVADFPAEFMNVNPPNMDYSPWQLLEHLRLTQLDILEYIRNASYKSPPHPEGYWPKPDQQADSETWKRTLEAFRSERDQLAAIVADPKTDLLLPMPHTPGHTVFREISLVAAHNQYHLGEFGILRQVMGTWPPGHV